jgi:uncharacterized lipoprotein NlpE involved in copper resistance
MKNAGSKEMTPRRIVTAMALIATLAGCQAQKESPVPDHLLGVWSTSAPRYADRYIEIRNDMIIFGTGGDAFELHVLTDVNEVREREAIVYTITHLNHFGQPYNLSFYYEPSGDGIIRFKNQREIAWTKERQ